MPPSTVGVQGPSILSRPARHLLLVATAAAAATLSACGGAGGGGDGGGGGAGGGGATQPTPQSALSGPLTVLAAASLTEAFTDARGSLRQEAPNLQLAIEFAGSQQLVAQVENGSPGDVVATADTTTMGKLVQAGLVETPRTLAHNRLAIVVAPGNPLGIISLADLARPDVAVVLAEPSVPVGHFAAQALEAAQVAVTPRSLELDVKGVLAKVELREADAGIVYVTDASAAGGHVTTVSIPTANNVVANYEIAVITSSAHRTAARAFADAAVGGSVQGALRRRGFDPP